MNKYKVGQIVHQNITGTIFTYIILSYEIVELKKTVIFYKVKNIETDYVQILSESDIF